MDKSSKKSKKGKFSINAFDFIVIVLLIVLVVGIFAKFVIFSDDKKMQVDITYDILVKSVRQETIDAFEIGQGVYEKANGYYIGEITSINSEGATDLMETLDGRVIEAPVENRYNLIISVKAEGIKDQNGLVSVNKCKIFDGKDINFDTQKNRCYGTFRNMQINYK